MEKKRALTPLNLEWKEHIFDYWKYGDGQWGYYFQEVVTKLSMDYEEWSKYLGHGVCKNKAELNCKMEELEGKYKKFFPWELEIPCGLKHITKAYIYSKDEESGQLGWAALTQFLHSCGMGTDNRREVLRLFSGILSGYCAHMIVPLVHQIHHIPLQERAPVLTVKYSDNAFDFLTQAMRALAVCTCVQEELRSRVSPILPNRLDQRDIDDCTFVYMKGKKKHKFPAQYRDTSILIYGRCFSANSIYRFLERNRWISAVLLDASDKVFKGVPIRLQTKLLSCLDFSWDTKSINYLTERFVWFLAKLHRKKQRNKRLKKRIDAIYQCIFQYHTQLGNKKYSPTEIYFLCIQMLTLELFLDSCFNDEIIDEQQRDQTRSDWFNALLPGCCTYLKPVEEGELLKETSEEEHIRQLFEDALTQMLSGDNLRHFLYVPPNGLFKEVDPEDPSCQYWGYLRYFKPKKDNQWKYEGSAPVLMFRKNKLNDFLGDFLSEPRNVNDVLNKLNSSRPDYFYAVKKERLPLNDPKEPPKEALILTVDDLKFLPEETHKALIAMIPNSKTEAE